MVQDIFKDKVVVITGASTGIGEALAHQLAAQGAWLGLGARNAERLAEVTTACQKHGGRALAATTDVTDPAQCGALIQKTVDSYGRIDMLVNNAGQTMFAIFEEVRDLSIFEQLMRVNYLGSVYCTYYALPHLKKARGRLVGVCSLTGKNGVPTRSGYAASKHAMVGFFDTLRIELAPHQVSVTMAYPDFVATGMRVRALDPDGQPLGRTTVEESKTMPVETCAQLILRAAERRQREVVMSGRAQLGQWLKLIAPGLVDRIAAQAIKTGH